MYVYIRGVLGVFGNWFGNWEGSSFPDWWNVLREFLYEERDHHS